MTWAADTAYVAGLEFLTKVAVQVAPGEWGRPSPCAGWRAVDVLGHIGSVVHFGTVILSSAEVAFEQSDPPGSAVEGDPSAWWQAKVGPAQAALAGVDLDRVLDSPLGSRSIGEGLSFPAVDLFVHAWDIGRSVGVRVTVPDEAIEFARRALDPIPVARLRSPGLFGPEFHGDATTGSDAFIAWTGRDPTWAGGNP